MLWSLATSPHGPKLMGPRVYAEVFSYLPPWLKVDGTSCVCVYIPLAFDVLVSGVPIGVLPSHLVLTHSLLHLTS